METTLQFSSSCFELNDNLSPLSCGVLEGADLLSLRWLLQCYKGLLNPWGVFSEICYKGLGFSTGKPTSVSCLPCMCLLLRPSVVYRLHILSTYKIINSNAPLLGIIFTNSKQHLQYPCLFPEGLKLLIISVVIIKLIKEGRTRFQLRFMDQTIINKSHGHRQFQNQATITPQMTRSALHILSNLYLCNKF